MIRSRPALVLSVSAAAALACRAQPSPDASHARVVAPPAPPRASPTASPFPKGSLYAESATFQLAVYFLPTPRRDPQRVLRELLQGEFAGFHRIERADEAAPAPTLLVAEPPIADYKPPDRDSLSYFGRGLSPAIVDKVQKSERVVTLTFHTRSPGRFAALRDACRLVSALARAAGGLVWDEESREIFTPEAWDERRLAGGWNGDVPHVPSHTVIHAYANPDLIRSVTLGMAKLGLPDVVVNDAARSNGNGVGNLINLACQTMAERGALEGAGQLPVAIDTLSDAKLRQDLAEKRVGNAVGKALLTVALGNKEDGDAENRLMEITFADGTGGVQERQQALLDRVFGSADELAHVKHDEELLAASRRAQHEILTRLKPLFQKRLAPRERLLVKAPFATPDGGQEWMWVEVVRWEGSTIHGILENDPELVPGLKSGARVEVAETVLFDYIHYRPDGSDEGNETGRIMERREPARAPGKPAPLTAGKPSPRAPDKP